MFEDDQLSQRWEGYLLDFSFQRSPLKTDPTVSAHFHQGAVKVHRRVSASGHLCTENGLLIESAQL